MFFSKMISATLATAIVFAYAVLVQCGDVPVTTCGTLYSGENFGGESFTLNDFDQSPNLKKEFRHSRDGWTVTKSIKVENGCKMTTCSDTYLLGSCQSFTSKDATPSQLLSTIKSVNCTCERICRCEDFYITNDEKEYGFIGRAYQERGCDSCNSEYLILHNSANIEDYGSDNLGSVRALVLYNGCSITLFSEEDSEGNKLGVIEGPVYRGGFRDAKSYSATCQLSKPVDRSSEFKAYLPLGDLPLGSKALQETLLSNKTLANHQGVLAALVSAKVNRSSRRVYVLIIGNIEPERFGFRKCTSDDYSDEIRECTIPVGVGNLRITTDLVIISVPSLAYDDAVEKLDAYLTGHEELNRNIPNAVIVSAFIEDKFILHQTGKLQKTLKALKEFRHRLIDDNYSNLIFSLEGLHALLPMEQQRQPETKLAQFEEIIRGKLDFLNPVAFSISSGAQNNMGDFTYVNGYAQLENGEFWPRSLDISLVNICGKSGDSLGNSVFRTYFKDGWPSRSNTRPIPVENTLSDQGTSVGESVHGRSDGQAIPGMSIDFDDLTERRAVGEDCGCAAVRTELKEEIDELKSELKVERTERLMEADGLKAAFWEELKLKWKMHFEL